HEGPRAIEGIDDPANGCGAGRLAVLLAEDGVVGEAPPDHVAHQSFRLAIGQRHGRLIRLPLHRCRAGPEVCERATTADPRRLLADLEEGAQVGLGGSHGRSSAAHAPRRKPADGAPTRGLRRQGEATVICERSVSAIPDTPDRKPGTDMERRPFGSRGRPVAVVGQGTWRIDGGNRRAAIAALRRGLDLGMTHVDTAEMYGGAEEL